MPFLSLSRARFFPCFFFLVSLRATTWYTKLILINRTHKNPIHCNEAMEQMQWFVKSCFHWFIQSFWLELSMNFIFCCNDKLFKWNERERKRVWEREKGSTQHKTLHTAKLLSKTKKKINYNVLQYWISQRNLTLDLNCLFE